MITVELEPRKIVLWVIFWLYILRSPSRWHSELRIPAQLAHLIDPADILAALVPVVAQYDSLSDGSFDQLVQKEQHHPEQVQSLTD